MTWYKLIYLVPSSHLEATKAALFATGAGEWGGYSQVCWQTQGQGQFMPQASANPHIGKAHTLEQVEEYRVEMLCADSILTTAIDQLKAAHPYEQPAIEAIALHYPTSAIDSNE